MSGNVKTVTDALVRVKDGGRSLAKVLKETESNYRKTSAPIQSASVANSQASPLSVAGKNATLELDAYKAPSLTEIAFNYAEDKYRKAVENANINADKKVFSLEQKLADGERNRTEQEERAANDFMTNYEKLSDSLVRKGTVHSSIREGLTSANESVYRVGLKNAYEKYDILVKSVNSEIEFAERARKAALADYDLKIAETYEKKLRQLAAEQQKNNGALADYARKIEDYYKNYEEHARRTEEEWARARKEGWIE